MDRTDSTALANEEAAPLATAVAASFYLIAFAPVAYTMCYAYHWGI